MLRNSYISETRLLDTAAKEIGARLPRRWRLLDREGDEAVRSPQDSSRRIDAIWEIRDPDGLSTDIIVEVKATPVEPRLVGSVESQLKALSDLRCRQASVNPVFMLVSTYLSPLTRERLAKAGISYADSTGNIRFTIERPAVYIETQGADRNPFRDERPLRSLKGGRAGRVVRGLLDYQTPFGTRELAAETASSPAMISRVCSLLEADEIVTKESPRGRIVSVDWETLARRWAMDYDFTASNTLTSWLEPRGTGALFARLRETGLQYSVTGSFAAYRLAPFAEPRLASLYVDDPETAAQSLGLRPADAGGNVLLVRPFDPVAFERAERDDGITYARVTQVLLDLMKGPGRGPIEAEALSGWMRDNEDRWKLSMTSTT
ncbi:MAG: type IV toxin-antitoxin system AbiEi family antitoxin [Chloroflexota bacterium]|nr:type IV toxin-antitoxin system AbiEi family antitoxin [Chloroflexota bacterium]